ncbi:MAG TPA: hypothetical protein VGC56_00690 [Allosphingosinicella sp.]
MLDFLGFAPNIQQAMLARGPMPSVLLVRFLGTSLSGQWSGILVTKGEHERFKDLKQPGETPAKTYAFTNPAG